MKTTVEISTIERKIMMTIIKYQIKILLTGKMTIYNDYHNDQKWRWRRKIEWWKKIYAPTTSSSMRRVLSVHGRSWLTKMSYSLCSLAVFLFAKATYLLRHSFILARQLTAFPYLSYPQYGPWYFFYKLSLCVQGILAVSFCFWA